MRSMRRMALDLGVSEGTIRNVVKKQLHMKPYKLKKGHILTDSAKQTRLVRCRALKARFAGGRHRNIIFSDEKLFTIEQHFNPHNDRILAKTGADIPAKLKIVPRQGHPPSVMVWAAVSSTGRTPLTFVEQGVKINATVYQEYILDGVLKPWVTSHYGITPFTFQQDSAPAHRAASTIAWLSANLADVILPTEWPPYSPDLNVMDYSIWGILEAKACSKPHKSVTSLKQSLQREWLNIPQETLCAATDSFPKRLKACIKSKGGYFE
jgi:inhibitor of nuclear factor kappa-B kinase subunit alpha